MPHRRHLPAQAPDIAGAQQQRDHDHEPAGRGGRTERVVAERLVIEIHGDNFGAARRAALRHQPDLGKQAEREDVAEQHRHQDRRHQQRQRDVAEALEWRGAVDLRGLVEIVGIASRAAYRMMKVNGRCSQIDSSATISSPCVGDERPVEDRQAERLQRGGQRPDIGVEQDSATSPPPRPR